MVTGTSRDNKIISKWLLFGSVIILNISGITEIYKSVAINRDLWARTKLNDENVRIKKNNTINQLLDIYEKPI